MRDVRRRCDGKVLGQRAAELGKPRGRPVRVLVDRGIGLGGRVTVIRGDVDDPRAGACRLCGAEQAVDERGADTVGRRGEHPAHRQCRDERHDLCFGHETQVPEHGREMREGFRDRFPWLRVGQDARDRKLWMAEHEAQRFAGHIAGAAEDQDGDA